MAHLFTNNATATLASSITAAATTIPLSSGSGSLFPSPVAPDIFHATLADVAGNTEIVRVTSRATDTLTVVRGQEGTAARNFAAGDRVELRLTAAALSSLANTEAMQAADAQLQLELQGLQLGLQALDTEKADASDVATALSGKASTGTNTFTGAQTLPGNAVNALEAVPKQQLDSKTTLASGAEALAGTDATKLVTPSTLRSGLNAAGGAPVFAARAWGVFNGQTVGTFAPTSGGNVASVSRVAIGVYQVNFVTPMPDANFTAVASINSTPGYNVGVCSVISRAVGSVTIATVGITGNNQSVADANTIFFAVLG